jgi:hypothetical protein
MLARIRAQGDGGRRNYRVTKSHLYVIDFVPRGLINYIIDYPELRQVGDYSIFFLINSQPRLSGLLHSITPTTT